jgi:hypothetical protein
VILSISKKAYSPVSFVDISIPPNPFIGVTAQTGDVFDEHEYVCNNAHTANDSDHLMHLQLDLDNDSFGYSPAYAAINSSGRRIEEIERILLVWRSQTVTIRGRLRHWPRRLSRISGQARKTLGPEAILGGNDAEGRTIAGELLVSL